MKEPEFAVRRFKNRNGVISYRVDGRLHGVRIRRNFKTRAEAIAEKAALDAQALQAAAGLRPTATFLTDDQLREAEAVFRRVGGLPRSLSFYVDFAVANYREPERQQALSEAVADYLAVRKQEHERTLVSLRQFRSITNELTTLRKHFPRKLISDLTPALLTPYLERGKPSLKTYNNRRGLVSTFFKFAFRHDWVTANPIEKTTYFRIAHRRGSAVTITAENAAALMTFVERYENGEMVPYFAICLFAGVRPCIRFGEITKLRPESVNLETGVIHIEPEVSKVRTKRHVTIQPNLAAWLRAYPMEKFPIIPPNAVNMLRRICKKFDLSHDVLRHTFISMFVAKFRSMGEAALQAGNSEAIIRKHYLDLKTAAEAEQFFGIMPTRRSEPVATIVEQSATPTPELGVAV